MKILIVTFTKKTASRMHLDASVIYRCINPATALTAAGFSVSLIHHTQVEAITDHADIVICHRPFSSKALGRTFKKFSNSRIIADYDDLLFCSDSVASHPAYLSGRNSHSGLLKSSRDYYQAACRFDEFIVSTEPLRKKIISQFPSAVCHTLHNGWSHEWFAFGKFQPVVKPIRKKICYFAGTSNHDQDLFLFAEELTGFLEENPDIDLEIYGSIDVSVFGRLGAQVRQGRQLPFYLFPSVIRQAWISIAPLIDTPFNQCKSAIKFIESGLFSVPVIASLTPDLKRMENIGLRIVSQENDWYQALTDMNKPESYRIYSEAAMQSAHAQSARSALSRSNLENAFSL